MTRNIFASLMIVSLAAASCGNITVQVKKDAKNSTLQSTPAPATASSTDNFSLANPEDFLKQLDGLRTTAADVIVKQLASQDYVGKFRSGVRKYRSFLLEKAQKQVPLSDSFYNDAAQNCREAGLSLNIDKDNEVLGMVLQTALLAKIGEVNVGKLNAGLPKEMQALSQFITMELGVEIKGVSSADKDGDMDVSRGNVTIKLLPIAGEAIDDATKLADENGVLTLNFERRVGADQIGTFHADLSLPTADAQIAEAKFDISRAKEGERLVHTAAVKMGMHNQVPNYSRQIIVSDIAGEKMKFNFTDILNAGTNAEASYKTVVDVDKRTQCKISAVVDPGKGDKDSDNGSNSGKGDEKPSTTPTTTPVQTPVQTPTQTPSQTPVKK